MPLKSRAAAFVSLASLSLSLSACEPRFEWTTVVNNGDAIPGFPERTFNSYNPPSVNARGLVVFRARGRGGDGEPPHGVYTRDMALPASLIELLADRETLVPYPNTRGSTFIEFPAFPRIGIDSEVVAFRGNSPPVHVNDEGEAAGTTGIFANPGGLLVTGASNLGPVSGFEFYAVPGVTPPTRFEVFPGAPSVADATTIVFKGNYTQDLVSETGAFYRPLAPAPAGGTAPIELLANTSDTLIPGTSVVFGSVAPPSAAGREAVFAGFDIEEAPTLGGLYLAPLEPAPTLTPLVTIGAPVPDRSGRGTDQTFTRLGEAVSFDGRVAAFWGAWGSATKPVVVHCPAEGNRQRIELCLEQCPEPGGCTFEVPANQGIFVVETRTGFTRRVAETGSRFDDFLFWTFSGRVPGSGEEDDGEPARWRASSFVAVQSAPGRFSAAFKATAQEGEQGIYMAFGLGPLVREPVVVVDTTMDGGVLDPEASGLPITALGLERDGLRNGWFALNASMANEEESWAGVYVTRDVPR